MSKSLKRRRILQGSILLSILLHLAEIHFLQRQSLWFSTPLLDKTVATDWIATMERKERNQILKESFAYTPYGPKQTRGQARTSSPSSVAQKPLKEAIHTDISPPLSWPDETPKQREILVSTSPLFPSSSWTFSPSLREPHLEKQPVSPLKLVKGTMYPAQKTPEITQSPPPFFPVPIPSSIALQENPSKKNLVICSETPAIQPLASSLFTEAKIPSPKAPPPLQPPIFRLASLHHLQTISHSQSFDTELVFIEQEEGKYIFALTLIPQEDLKLTPLKQNYFFLIDRSNSVQGERLQATKSAVRKALEELSSEDRFNIIVFDQKVEKFSATSLSATHESIGKAQNFLDTIELGSFFSQSNLYKPLFLTLPAATSENELYTAILLTDGESLGQKNTIPTLLHDWTFMNAGKVSLFALGMNEDPHLETLNTITMFNRGKTIASPTKRGLKRKLLKLMKTLHAPVAKNLACKAIPRNASKTIELFPHTSHSPPLFLNEPYVILGSTDSLDDFVLFVQGRLNGEWLHIKKHVSFANAKKGSSSLKSEWALQKAFTLYQEYQLSEDDSYLAEAQNLLQSYDLQGIFQ